MPSTRLRPIVVILLLSALCLAGPAPAQEPQPERLAFVEGADRGAVQGAIRGPEAAAFLLAATAGKWMRVELSASHTGAYLDVFAPGAAEAMHVGAVSGNLFAGIVPVTGDYRIQVHLAGSGARRNERARFTLTAAVVDRADAAGAARQPETADSLTGGPDFWSVTGLPRGQRLNLRDGPSGRAPVLGRLAQGEVLRNRGCRSAEGDRWCRVERAEGGAQGWVAGRYLREAEAPAEAPPPAAAAAAPPAPPPATALRPYDATGLLPCAMVRGQPSRECRFGVERRGTGAAVVEVLGSNGVTRRITFERGAPVRSDAEAELRSEKFGELFLIRIGDERFEVPEAVVTGG